MPGLSSTLFCCFGGSGTSASSTVLPPVTPYQRSTSKSNEDFKQKEQKCADGVSTQALNGLRVRLASADACWASRLFSSVVVVTEASQAKLVGLFGTTTGTQGHTFLVALARMGPAAAALAVGETLLMPRFGEGLGGVPAPILLPPWQLPPSLSSSDHTASNGLPHPAPAAKSTLGVQKSCADELLLLSDPGWQRFLGGLRGFCPPEGPGRDYVVLAPLSLGSQLVGGLLLVLPAEEPSQRASAEAKPQQQQQQQQQHQAVCGDTDRGGEEGGKTAAGAPPLLWRALMREAGAVQALSACVAECCLGPVLPAVEQVCCSCGQLDESASLHDLAAHLTAALTNTLCAELHIELGVRLAILPHSGSQHGLLFEDASRLLTTTGVAAVNSAGGVGGGAASLRLHKSASMSYLCQPAGAGGSAAALAASPGSRAMMMLSSGIRLVPGTGCGSGGAGGRSLLQAAAARSVAMATGPSSMDDLLGGQQPGPTAALDGGVGAVGSIKSGTAPQIRAVASPPASTGRSQIKASAFSVPSTLAASLLASPNICSVTSNLPRAAYGSSNGTGGGCVASWSGPDTPSSGCMPPALRLSTAVVLSVSSFLHDAEHPHADLFMIYKRSGSATGLASLVAVAAWWAPDASAVGGTASRTGMAVPDLTSLASQGKSSSTAAVRAWVGNETAAGRRSRAQRAGGLSSGISIIGSGTLGRGGGNGAAAAAAALGDNTASTSSMQDGGNLGVGLGFPGGGGGGGAAPAFVLYLTSALPLPAPLLAAARDRAAALLEVLLPAAARALLGPIQEEWSILCTQIESLGPGGQAGGSISANAAEEAAAPVGRGGAPDSASLAGERHLGRGPQKRTANGLLQSNGSTAAPSSDTTMGGLPWNTQGCSGSLRPRSSLFRQNTGGTNGHLDERVAQSLHVSGSVTTGSRAVDASISANVAAAAGLDQRNLDMALPARGGMGVSDMYGNMSTDSVFGAACRGIAGGTADMAAMPPDGFIRLPPSCPSPLYDPRTRQSSLMGMGGLPDAPDEEPFSLSGRGGGTAGAIAAAGTGSRADVGSLLTTVLSDARDAAKEARQQQMDIMVSTFHSALNRVRNEAGALGGGHAEDDVRSLRLVKTLGQGGCSVVLLARLHAMPVAVKVILPPDMDEPEPDPQEPSLALTSAQTSPGRATAPESHSPRHEAAWSTGSKTGPTTAGGGGGSICNTWDTGVRTSSSGRTLDMTSSGRGAGKVDGGGRTAVRPSRGVRREQLRLMLQGARELAVMTSISHPNIVQVYSYCTRVLISEARSGVPQLDVAPEGAVQTAPLCTALIMEYCDMGSLADVIDSGLFARAIKTAAAALQTSRGRSSQSAAMGRADRASLLAAGAEADRRGATMTGSGGGGGGRSPALVSNAVAATAGGAGMRAIYLTLLEVALALRHLHAMQLVHCDVKPANVLLRSSATDPRGFTAKLTDFGFVSLVEQRPDGQLEEEGKGTSHPPSGTVTHMAPELFVKGTTVDASVDIYAFGILMWELCTGLAPYPEFAERQFVEVPYKVVKEGLRPRFPPDTPLHYKLLAQECWSSQASCRPTAAALVSKLQHLLDLSCGVVQPQQDRL